MIPDREIEVEQKFSLPLSSTCSDDEMLKDLALRIEVLQTPDADGTKWSVTKGKAISFVDTYYEISNERSANKIPWLLTTSDFWLRYRQTVKDDRFEKGSWQLKFPTSLTRNRNDEDCLSRASTIYEEYEGAKAICTAANFLRKRGMEFENFDETSIDCSSSVPPSCLRLRPFAKFRTTRRSWCLHLKSETRVGTILEENPESSEHETFDRVLDQSNIWSPLKIDFDFADFGYSIGEVEAVVKKEADISSAQRSCQRLLQKMGIGEDANNIPSEGKLVKYLMKHDFKHYCACVHAGTM
mmetsp:Transcript_27078/g.62279  ORF Transcript_27078/g.62279 Transcript_27078/m.62279 type:complete len:298 (-) Transcript_27078:126-1019(-)